MREENEKYEELLVSKQEEWEANLDEEARAKLTPGHLAALKIPIADRHPEQQRYTRRAYFRQDAGHQERTKALGSRREAEA